MTDPGEPTTPSPDDVVPERLAPEAVASADSAPDLTYPPAIDVELVPPAPSTSDWPAKAADSIVNLVDQVRAKTTGPAITVARSLVFGIMVGVLGLVTAVLLLIFAVRLTTELLELVWDGSGVWLTYLIYGVIFTGVGGIIFGKRHIRGFD